MHCLRFVCRRKRGRPAEAPDDTGAEPVFPVRTSSGEGGTGGDGKGKGKKKSGGGFQALGLSQPVLSGILRMGELWVVDASRLPTADCALQTHLQS